jgi:hypothetical protein
MRDLVERHCREIERCNQRGGRMLSIVDLIEAGTLDEDLAAYSLATIRQGASFMVGARPGGAGKTTVMGALLNLVPADVELAAADGPATVKSGMAARDRRRCYICHEIGAGPYYAYLWDEPLRRYFDLPLAGHMLATNLHADTCLEARQQVCGDNGVSREAFRRMSLLFFLRVTRGFRSKRKVIEVWESDGTSDHACVYGEGVSPALVAASNRVEAEAFANARGEIERLLSSGRKTIQDVRAMLA